MSMMLPPSKRAIVREAAFDALATACPGSFSDDRWRRPGGIVEVEKHLDQLIEIVRRTTAAQIEPYLVQILQDICQTCSHQEASGYCSLRGIRQCTVYT